ncbi:hypothetical protein AYI69_g4495 [Smittium culicis]|uniref:Uncharacterized protein n=1 Tax=Smittium culicis TaxID=133412 RepID=A0A1R1YD63_9FUNG|nr:hypothetical protein AYI69_g4495 [Smittium culicis]
MCESFSILNNDTIDKKDGCKKIRVSTFDGYKASIITINIDDIQERLIELGAEQIDPFSASFTKTSIVPDFDLVLPFYPSGISI